MSTPQAPQRTVGKAAVSYQVIQVGVARNPVVEPRPPRILCQGEAARYIRKNKRRRGKEGKWDGVSTLAATPFSPRWRKETISYVFLC